MPAVAEFVVEASPEPWERIGLTILDDAAQIGGVRLRFAPGERGIVSWGLAGLADAPSDIDGLATHATPAPDGPPPPNAMGATGFEQVLITTSSLDRTSAAIEAATGSELKRVRDGGTFRQGFHRLGDTLLEIIESPRVTAEHASFGGFLVNVADLPELTARLGLDVISEQRIAVQTGRYIASFRGSLGLGVPLAVMTPPLEWTPELAAQAQEWEAMRLASRTRS